MSAVPTTKLVLPQPIEAYFAATAVDASAVALCFTENAVVTDERQSYVGRASIRRWKEATTSAYSYVSEPFALHDDGGTITVTSHVTGNFPGNKIDLRYIFRLEGAQISQLEICV